ncbi:AAA family ATPase [Herbaspirillum chlorophenolicum]|uniref:AAA family ATPase n=1 Tax=Herbaspirillum chlorophenolicum TaxID=211589 RepID=UPI00067DA144|nr:ATP-binding protein [Herbaspirillum chlorophenolicum]
MKIKKLQLTNGYKRFHNLTIDLGNKPARIVALVGPNGCGKSSVLDGILYHFSRYHSIGNTGHRGYEYHSMKKDPNFTQDHIHIDFEHGTFSEGYEKLRAIGREKTMFSFRSPYRYNSQLNVVQIRAIEEVRENNYGARSAADIDSKMEENYRRLNAKYNRYLHDKDCRPSEAKEKIIGDLNSSIKKCLSIEISSLGDVESSRGTIYFKKPDQSDEFDFNVLSSGEKEVVDILMDLYLRQEEYQNTVFLLDEPELHINTGIQRNLLLEIDRLVGETCQIWLTTHSIGFLRSLQEDLGEKCQIVRFSSDANYASEEHVLYPMKKSRLNWKDLFEVALDDLAHLICPKKIIFCEGRDQPGAGGRERGFDALVFNNIFSSEYQEVIFVSSGGNTELDQRSDIAFSILSKVFSSLEIFVLKDRDMASGLGTTERDRQIYLDNNPKNHRVLKRWEIENYLYDQEVLKRYCEKNGLQFNQTLYDSLVTDIENQNLKDLTGKIKSICGITGSISSEAFKLNLSKCISSDMLVYSELEKCIF